MALVDEKLNVVASTLQPYAEPVVSPHPGWREQNPLVWWQAVEEGIRELVKSAGDSRLIRAIGLTGQMHGLTALDRQGEVVRPCIVYSDLRNSEQCIQITDKAGGAEEYYRKTGNRMISACTGATMLWMKQNEPELFEKTVVVVSPKDYIRYRLTGGMATDVSDASGFGVFDVAHRIWNDELIREIGLPREIFPKAHESVEIVGEVLPAVAERLGIPIGVRVAAGGGDAAVQPLGSGALAKAGAFTSTIGTSGFVSGLFDHYVPDKNGALQMICANESGHWTAHGGATAGLALMWLEKVFFAEERHVAELLGENVYEILDREAAMAPPGSNGLLFYPMLFGQRCPEPDNHAKGCFVGINMQHDKRHFFRSALEGVALGIKVCARLLEKMDANNNIKSMNINGGGASSRLWCQIMADIFGVEIRRPVHYTNGGSIGAAMIAGTGAGLWSSLKEASSLIEIGLRVEPDQSNSDMYEKLEQAYSAIHPSLKQVFPILAQIAK